MKRIGILRGGSDFTEQSLHLGTKLATLLGSDAVVVDFLVDTEGGLFMAGKPLIPIMADHFVDKIIDLTYKIPNTGISLTNTFRGLGIPTMASSDMERALFSNRALMQKYLTPYEINFPYAITTHIPLGHDVTTVVTAVHKSLPPPWRVWDGIAWHSAKTNAELHAILHKAPRETDIYIQERPLGHRVEVLAIRNFRTHDIYISLSVTMDGKLIPLSAHYSDQIRNELKRLMHLFAHTDTMLASFICKTGKPAMLSSLDYVHLCDDHAIVSAIREESGITDEELKRWYLK